MLGNLFGRLSSTPCRTRAYSQSTYRRFNNGNGNTFRHLLFDASSRKYLAIVFGGGSLFYLTHLEEAPISGRKRFIWIPASLELMIGKYTYKSVLRQTGNAILPQNDPTTRRVARVFERIVEAAHRDSSVDKSLLKDIDWKIHVVNDPRAPPNAFVLPGGKVFVFSSMLGICQNDDGLATVLSHEFAHQLARHTGENLSKAPVYTILSVVLYTLTGVDTFNNILLDGLVRMPASRQMETEADYIGLMIMSRACFNPDESIRLWKRMADFESRNFRGAANFEFLSTHPASERRIQNMAQWLSRAHELYDESDCRGLRQHWQQWRSNTPIIFPGF
ncbi:hypothetical protein HG537_0G02370 [Torulaspora globosa]|uniref:Peptidase M48 domain-containing protein n=1 Tax=Torulaspora globosa TaxID=48254 RepID=A0A7H9HXF1_9SACH|nr:hypothetical protein HG537_0G02370 [Torulaspora sp. CBS 2947]